MRARVVLLAVVGWVSWAVPAQAQRTITVTLAPGPGTNLATQLGITRAELESMIDAELQDAFALNKPDDFLEGLANAAAFSNKGLGVDYATNEDIFIAGVAANVALALGSEEFGEVDSDRPLEGIQPNVSIMGGFNLGSLDVEMPWLENFTVYGNWFTRRQQVEDIHVRLSNFGLHLQYKLFGPDEDASGALGWGGIDFTAGYLWSRLTSSLGSGTLETTMPLGRVAGQTVEGDLRSVGILRMNTSATSIPLEASTNFDLLWLVTVFGGVGVDIQTGKAKLRAELEGTIEADNPASGNRIALGTAEVSAEESGDPRTGQARFFGGVQLNLWALHFFAQLNLLPDAAVSVAMGARAGW